MFSGRFFVIAAALFLSLAEAFAPLGTDRFSTSLTASRRSFVEAAFAVTFVAAPAFAIDDLSMPTEAEQQSSEEEMKRRLELKAKLQKQVSQPRSFQESLKGEMSKQEGMKKQTKQERRDALCEELGRGC